MDDELKKSLNDIKNGQRQMFSVVQGLQVEVRKVGEKADIAHATALEAKQAAHRFSESAEGGDHSILAEMGSMKVVLSEAVTTIKDIETDRKREAKTTARIAKRWKIAQPVLLAIVVGAAQFITQSTSISNVASKPAMASPVDGGQ